MSTVRRIASNYFWQALSNISQKVLSLVILLVLARKLGVENFGLYSFAFSFVTTFAIFADFGINLITMREVAKSGAASREFCSNAHTLKIILSLLSFFAIVFSGFIVGLKPSLLFLVVLAGISLLLDNVVGLFKGIFFAFEMLKYEFVISFSNKIVFLLAGFAVIFAGFGLNELLMVSILSSLLSLFVSVYLASRYAVMPSLSFNVPGLLSVLKLTRLFFLITLLFGLTANLDILFLQYFWNEAEVGIYSAAMRLVSTLGMIAIIFTNSVQPSMIKFYAHKNQSINTVVWKSVYYLAVLILPICVITLFMARDIVLLFFDTEFLRSALPLSILVLSSIFSFALVVFTNALISMHQEKKLFMQLVLELLALVMLGLLLIPQKAEVGAAFAVLGAKIISFIIGYLLIVRYLEKMSLAKIYLKPAAASLLMGVFTMVLAPLGLFVAVPASFAVYGLIMFLIRGINDEDISFLKKLLYKKQEQSANDVGS
ncbi:MAG: flippase [archaeon]|nr:flippase [archaeon]